MTDYLIKWMVLGHGASSKTTEPLLGLVVKDLLSAGIELVQVERVGVAVAAPSITEYHATRSEQFLRHINYEGWERPFPLCEMQGVAVRWYICLGSEENTYVVDSVADGPLAARRSKTFYVIKAATRIGAWQAALEFVSAKVLEDLKSNDY